jgi:hypothetical protein
MSSTTNVQNLITTVFRPVYYYANGAGFTPHMEMSNIDTYIGNEVRVFRAQVGTSIGNNVYVGVGSGQPYTKDTGNVNLTAVGYNAGANTTRVTNSVYLGSSVGVSLTDVSAVIAIGASTSGQGSNNIFIGNKTGNASSNNIYIGHNLVPASTVSNSLDINNLIYGDFSNQWVGIGTSNRLYTTVPQGMDVCGTLCVFGKVGIQMSPVNSLNVNGATQSTGGYYSASGSNNMAPGDVVIIGTFGDGTSASKMGNALITVQDMPSPGTPGTNYETGMYFYRGTSLAPVQLTSTTDTQGGHAHITFSSSNIQISNASTGSSHLYYWSITHFPLTP